MKTTTFANLYDEYESQRQDELRFLAEEQEIRTPYTPPQKENNTMNKYIIIHYKTGYTTIYKRNVLVVHEILDQKDTIEEIWEAETEKSFEHEEEVAVLFLASGSIRLFATKEAALIDYLIVDFDIIEDSYFAQYYKGE